MNPDYACKLIGQASYKPGWIFRAESYDRYQNTVKLTIEFDALNTDTVNAPTYDGPLFRQSQAFYLHVSHCARELDLWDMVIECVVHFELHELREFFAVDAEFTKPYHAHTSEGVVNWRSRPPFETQNDLADVTIMVHPVAQRPWSPPQLTIV